MACEQGEQKSPWDCQGIDATYTMSYADTKEIDGISDPPR